jgi:hypothetical protein
MLTEKDVVHLTEQFQESPNEDVFEEACKYVNQFTDESSFAQFCAGISAVALYTENPYYKQLSKALFDIGIENEFNIYDLMPWHVPVDGLRNNVFTVQETSEKVSKLKEKDLKVGFIHGHYRILTPANFANALIASERCDYLVLGIEEGLRTKHFKKVEPLVPLVKDWYRRQWILASGFDGCICRIRGFAYTNKGYEKILRIINPDIYFSNKSLSEESQKIMEDRAINNGISFVLLPEQEGFHTSEFFDSV